MSGSTTLVIRNGTALVGPAMEAVELGEIRVAGDTIEAVGAEGGERAATVLDAKGCFVLPGLADAHVHLDLEAGPDVIRGWREDRSAREATIRRNGLRALASGVTSVRDVGSADHATLAYAALVERGEATGPRVAACGRMIVRPGGHAWQAGRVAASADELRAAVREQVSAGARLVKVMASGGFSTPGDVGAAELTTDQLRAVADEAHRASLPVAAHAHAAEAIANCLDAGIDTIEHGAFLDERLIERMAARGVPLVPTLRAIDVITSDSPLDPDIVRRVDEARERYATSVRNAIEAGVPIAAGTDAGTPLNEHGGLVSELERYVELGMSPIDAIRAATWFAGRWIDERVGAIAPGRAADLLVVEGDPRESIAALRSLRHVVLGGVVLDVDGLLSTLEPGNRMVRA
jgi:imidazolonepropionase-like amidohydrolase